MKASAILWGLVAAVLILACAQTQAAVVGRFTQVEGRVDLLKGGNLPATPVQVNGTVEPKDVIRTKSLSKAQITFIDNSVLSISPGSRIAIEEYLVDTVQGKRRAVLEVFRGLALAVVNKIFQVEEPDFVVKTQTAIMGVRGTEFGIRILPNSSTIMNFKGLLQVGNIFPEISQLFLKAFKVAYSFGPLDKKSDRWVFLKDMQATTVARDLPPTLPYGLSIQDRELFMRQLISIVPQESNVYQGSDQGLATAGLPKGSVSSASPVAFSNPGEATTLAVLNTVTVPPALLPQPQVTPKAVSQVTPTAISQVTPTAVTPVSQAFTFAQMFEGTYSKTSPVPYAVATYINSTAGSGIRTGVYPSTFTANFSIAATGPNGTFSPSSSGTFSVTSTGNVTGLPGGVLTGTMQMNAATGSGTTFTFSGPVTLSPTGNLTFQTSGTFVAGSNTGTTTGTWTQANSAPVVSAVSSTAH
jgi:hypothetical protein